MNEPEEEKDCRKLGLGHTFEKLYETENTIMYACSDCGTLFEDPKPKPYEGRFHQ